MYNFRIKGSIEIMDFTNNKGVIPIVLGNARIFEYNLQFLHAINTSSYLPIITDNLDNLAEYEKPIRNKTNLSTYFQNRIRIIRKESKTLTETFLSLRPNIRQKRGIHVIFGDVIQGNTDRINEALNKINTNENAIVSKINEQIQINTAMINRFRDLENQLTGEINLMKIRINQNTDKLQEIELILLYEQSLHTIEFVIRNLQQHLDEILDSISLAKQGYISHYLLSSDESDFIYKNLENQNIKINSEHELYQFLSISIIYKHPLIAFAVKIPQFTKTIFKHIQLYPTTINKTFTIQIPAKYISLSEKFAKYSNEPCNKIDDTYYCTNEKLQDSNDKCIENILNNKQSSCNLTEGDIKPYIKQLEQQFLIINQQSDPEYHTNCINQETKHLPRQSLIKFNNCSITINGKKFESSNKIYTEAYSYIPYNDIKIHNTTRPLELSAVSNLTIQNMEKLKEFQKMTISQEHHYTTWGITSIFIISIISYICILRYCPSCTPCQWYIKIKNSSDVKSIQQNFRKSSTTNFTEDSKNQRMEELQSPTVTVTTAPTQAVFPRIPL